MSTEIIRAGETLYRTYLTIGLSIVLAGLFGLLFWLWRGVFRGRG